MSITPEMMAAMADEMMKIGFNIKPPSLSKALGVNALSTSAVGRRSSVNVAKAVTRPQTPSLGQVSQVASAPKPKSGIRGANIMTPTTVDPKMPLIRQENLRAGPGHIAQSTPAVPMTQQGRPPMVSTPAPTGGTLGGGAAGSTTQGASQSVRSR